ncbi:MAG: hypothetical protein U0573_08170 [Phycisphaerales bacterium]|nr:hypothetical protein [Planctomycetota bacterium]
MKIHFAVLVLVALGHFLPGSSPAGQAGDQAPVNFVPPQQRNAAIRYLIAVATISPEVNTKIRELDWHEIGDNIDPAKMPASFNELAKLPMNGAIQFATEGSKMDRCNFEINYEAGVNALLPQLGYMRQLGRVLRLNARLLESEGKAGDAAERLQTLLRLSEHVRQDGWLICVLVSFALDSIAFDEIRLLAAMPQLPAQKRAELLAMLEARNVADPLHFQAAIETEMRSIIPQIERDAARPDGPKVIAEIMGDQPGAAAIAALSSEELQKQVARLRPMYAEYLKAVSPESSDEQAAQIYARVTSGEYGSLGAAFMPDVKNLRGSRARYLSELAVAINALKKTPAAQ